MHLEVLILFLLLLDDRNRALLTRVFALYLSMKPYVCNVSLIQKKKERENLKESIFDKHDAIHNHNTSFSFNYSIPRRETYPSLCS